MIWRHNIVYEIVNALSVFPESYDQTLVEVWKNEKSFEHTSRRRLFHSCFDFSQTFRSVQNRRTKTCASCGKCLLRNQTVRSTVNSLVSDHPLMHEKVVAYERWSLTGTVNEINPKLCRSTNKDNNFCKVITFIS